MSQVGHGIALCSDLFSKSRPCGWTDRSDAVGGRDCGEVGGRDRVAAPILTLASDPGQVPHNSRSAPTSLLAPNHRVGPQACWSLVRHAGWLSTSFQVRPHGSTVCAFSRHRPYQGELAEIGELVWDQVPGLRKSNLEMDWAQGI